MKRFNLLFIMKDTVNLTSTFKISSLDIFLIIAAIFLLSLELCSCACARAEYEINGECCPMCSPGSRVYRHCTEDTSTTCVPCIDSSYTAEPNGLEQCLTCSACDPGYGLRIKKQCTLWSDTVCEPLEGHYCTDHVRSSCTQAVEHTTCSPGQYIKQKGTALKDTVCDACTAGTYSNGSLQICQPHSKCEDLGCVEIKPGTSSSDAECGKPTSVPVVAGITVGLVVVLMVVAAVGVVMFLKKKYKRVPPAAEDDERTRCDETRQDGSVRQELTNVKERHTSSHEDNGQPQTLRQGGLNM